MPKTDDLNAKTHVFVDNNLMQLKYKGQTVYMPILNKRPMALDRSTEFLFLWTMSFEIIVIHLIISHIQLINLDINE